ncbi:MAG: DUF374 domain-containing protein [Pelagibacterales bacterium]|nr:DUF374 domain-containing protein [Pelagibacterales bacterium]
MMNKKVKKWKILGYKTNLEWYDIKTKFKQLLRKITYSWAFQKLICLIISSYMRLIYYSSKKVFIHHEKIFAAAKNKTPLILVFWHNRLMMIPFITEQPKKTYKDYNFMTLASRHGDGQFVGKVMENFGLISILGSSKDGRKSSRGIDLASFRRIFDGLKKGYSLGITPDGPRGPNQKINGEIVNIARISGAKILALSYSASRYKTLNTWDKFYIPLPFSKLCFYFDEIEISVSKNCDEKTMEDIKLQVEDRINFCQEKSQEMTFECQIF